MAAMTHLSNDLWKLTGSGAAKVGTGMAHAPPTKDQYTLIEGSSTLLKQSNDLPVPYQLAMLLPTGAQSLY